MIAVSQVMARLFRAAARKCISGRARAPDPEVVIRQAEGKITFTAHYPEVILQLALTTPSQEESLLVVPMRVLEQLEEVKSDHIELHCPQNLRGEARWIEQSKSSSFSVQFLLPGKQHSPPKLPTEFRSVPGSFLGYLHECGRSTAKEDGRYALGHIQVRGKQGQLIATDGKFALICGGWSFPFTEDLLIPAIPLFGMKELESDTVQVGRSETHLVVTSGPFTVWLAIANAARFPDVATVIPRQSTTLARIHQQDTVSLLKDLAGLPGASHEDRPVTLDLDECVTVRGRDSQATREIVLHHSPVEGPPARLAVDRRMLARALSLRCLTLRVTEDKPLVAVNEAMTVIAVQLEAKEIVPPKEKTHSSTVTDTQPISLSERTNPVKGHELNGRSPTGRSEPPQPAESADPLIVAEELRAALLDVSMKANKLVAMLKTGRKEKKVLASVFAGLKQLNLNGGPNQ